LAPTDGKDVALFLRKTQMTELKRACFPPFPHLVFLYSHDYRWATAR